MKNSLGSLFFIAIVIIVLNWSNYFVGFEATVIFGIAYIIGTMTKGSVDNED